MLAWDALVLLAALLDGMRLPTRRKSDRHAKLVECAVARQRDRDRTDHRKPGLRHHRVPLDRRSAARARDPAAQQEPIRVTAFPRVPASDPLSRGTAGTRRLHHRPALRPLSLTAWPGRALGEGAARRRPCASIRHCAPAKSSRSFSRAAARSTCNCARRGSAAWAATSKACANTAKATTCATSAGRPLRGAETSSRASTRPSAASRCGSCSTADA